MRTLNANYPEYTVAKWAKASSRIMKMLFRCSILILAVLVICCQSQSHLWRRPRTKSRKPIRLLCNSLRSVPSRPVVHQRVLEGNSTTLRWEQILPGKNRLCRVNCTQDSKGIPEGRFEENLDIDFYELRLTNVQKKDDGILCNATYLNETRPLKLQVVSLTSIYTITEDPRSVGDKSSISDNGKDEYFAPTEVTPCSSEDSSPITESLPPQTSSTRSAIIIGLTLLFVFISIFIFFLVLRIQKKACFAPQGHMLVPTVDSARTI